VRCRPRTTALHRFLGIAPGAAPPWLCAPDACQGFDLLQAAELVIIAGVVVLGVVRGSWRPLLVAIPAMAWFGLRVHAPFEGHERLWRARRRRGECPWCGRRGDGPGGSCRGCGDRAEHVDPADPPVGGPPNLVVSRLTNHCQR
jgi:hypothetical protein